MALAPVASGFSDPLAIVEPPDGSGRLFVVERTGRIRIIANGQVLATPFLDVSSAIVDDGSEQGLLGLAFHPDYAGNGLFFIYYTATGTGANTLARYQVSSDPSRANTNGTVLFAIPDTRPNHNGGNLLFGPDRYLYIGTGDGGGSGDPDGHAQALDTLLGKLLRIDVNGGSPYAIPLTNPFVGQAGARGEIWAYGLRNPWRFSFDRQTGDLFIADVGQGLYEEVDLQPSGSSGGQNYGWPILEGLHCYNTSTCSQAGLTLPILEYSHDQGDCSITGGYLYRGPSAPSLAGAYLYADFCTGRVWTMRPTGASWTSTQIMDTPYMVSAFGEDRNGDVYLIDFGGSIYKFVAAGAPSATPTAFTSTPTATLTPPATQTPTFVATATPSATSVSVPTATPPNPPSPTPTPSLTAAATATHSLTPSPTLTAAQTPAASITAQASSTLTIVPSTTVSATQTPPVTASSTGTTNPTTQPSLTLTGGATPTFPPGALGGRGFTLRVNGLGNTTLSWLPGTAQTGYVLVAYLPEGPVLIPLGSEATFYTDSSASPTTCYLLGVLRGSSVAGLSDLLCTFRGHQSGVVPSTFGLNLNGGLANLSWSGVSSASGYALQSLNGDPTVNLGPTTLTTSRPIPEPACYALSVLGQGAISGSTNIVCGLPGINTLGG